ncbi:MAG: methyltransferase domain-containing protein [Myxococcales bacterium]|nr:methyltransferase domain-containing protein [Myxococcales bacterium]HIK85933.1 methyltransferase domain-containing protein [Myxococcales bacterium]
MAVSCPIDFDARALRVEVSKIYSRVATEPDAEFHFHRGPDYAARLLGYDREQLAGLPERSTSSFAGVSNPLAIDDIRAGERILDIGCGAGMDLLLAALRVGPTGQAIGVDMTPEMLESTRQSAEDLGLPNVHLKFGDAEDLPLDEESIDVVISNGVLNLTTDKEKAFSEIARVLKPGGRLLLGDIAVAEELSLDIRNDIDLWTG